jgi:AAHS family 4-hydroxybenzoate transporter-like MFS transporter
MESVHSISSIDVSELLDTGRWSRYQKLLTALVAIAVVFDGFDIQILGFAIPSLIREWHAASAEFGVVLAAGLAGMVVGALIAGYAGDRFGRRPAVIGCVVMFGLSTLATAFVGGFIGLTILRFITGIATGGLFPNVSALSAELAPLRRRSTAVKLVPAPCHSGHFVYPNCGTVQMLTVSPCARK